MACDVSPVAMFSLCLLSFLLNLSLILVGSMLVVSETVEAVLCRIKRAMICLSATDREQQGMNEQTIPGRPELLVISTIAIGLN